MLSLFTIVSIMIGFTVFLAMVSSVFAGYSGSSNTGGNQVGDGSYGYGYSGSFSGPGGAGSGQSNGGIPPQFQSQFDFFNFLNSYFDSLRKYHQQFSDNVQQDNQNAASGYGFPGGFPAFAGFGGAGQGQGNYGGGLGGSFGVPHGGEGASASANIGPGGVHQTAGVYPENPNNPNVNTRFGEAPKGDGFYSVSTSSFSGSSNLDGKPTSFQQASTTVNDNGKVTTYTVRKP